MISCLKHSVLLSVLIIVGLVFAQMHEAAHSAELFQIENEHSEKQGSSNQEKNDCLVCTITITGFDTETTSVHPDYLSKEILTLHNYSFIKNSFKKHIRLRAPPVLQIIS